MYVMLPLLLLLVTRLAVVVAEGVTETANPATFGGCDNRELGELLKAMTQSPVNRACKTVRMKDPVSKEEDVILYTMLLSEGIKDPADLSEANYPSKPLQVPLALHYSLRFDAVYANALMCDHRGFASQGGFEWSHKDSLSKDQNIFPSPTDCPDGYDKGHLAAAKSFSWSEASMSATFVFKNQLCQLSLINSQIWRKLEALSRLLTWVNTGGQVDVLVGPFESDNVWFATKKSSSQRKSKAAWSKAKVPVPSRINMCVVCRDCWFPTVAIPAPQQPSNDNQHGVTLTPPPAAKSPTGFVFCVGHNNLETPLTYAENRLSHLQTELAGLRQQLRNTKRANHLEKELSDREELSDAVQETFEEMETVTAIAKKRKHDPLKANESGVDYELKVRAAKQQHNLARKKKREKQQHRLWLPKRDSKLMSLMSQWDTKLAEVDQVKQELFLLQRQEQTVAEALGISADDKDLLKITIDTSRLEVALMSSRMYNDPTLIRLKKKHVFALLKSSIPETFNRSQMPWTLSLKKYLKDKLASLATADQKKFMAQQVDDRAVEAQQDCGRIAVQLRGRCVNNEVGVDVPDSCLPSEAAVAESEADSIA
eukprot:GILJ01009613.1.p1 GENE.GILJ01009613.1~~GILJ01009613.1.p1  ORF type:complete len:597 (-),score=92.26 GILJ01009613.1:246-2036(-)